MSKLIRNMSDPASAQFWRSVQESAAGLSSAPTWMRAGIVVNKQNFVTYEPHDESDAATVDLPLETIVRR